jgi:prevent-host-death family protein
MTHVFNLTEAEDQLSSLVDRAVAGEETIIAKHGKPVAKLVPLQVEKKEGPRKPSELFKVKWIAPDFDDPLPPELLKQFGYDP